VDQLLLVQSTQIVLTIELWLASMGLSQATQASDTATSQATEYRMSSIPLDAINNKRAIPSVAKLRKAIKETIT
jgi:hypothetical protein